MHKLSEIDEKILNNLLKDCRISYDQLAKECNTTKNIIWKRCRTLEKRGILKGATLQLNYSQFGYEALATLLIKVKPQKVDTAIEFMKKKMELTVYRQYNNVYNVRAVATLIDLKELEHIKQAIREKFSTVGLKTYIWTGIRTIPENLNLSGKSISPNKYFEREITRRDLNFSIDAIDMKIVQELSRDSRASFSEIAKHIDLSTHTVINRYNALRASRVIKPSVVIDPTKFGYVAMLDLNIAFTSLQGLSIDFIDMISKIPDVVIVARTSGDYDLQVTAMIRDLKQSFTIQEKVAKLVGVTQIEASTRKVPTKWPTPRQHITTI